MFKSVMDASDGHSCRVTALDCELLEPRVFLYLVCAPARPGTYGRIYPSFQWIVGPLLFLLRCH